MTFFARQPNGQTEALPVEEGLPPQWLDGLARRSFGIGFADVRNAAKEAGDMIAALKAQLDRIESGQLHLTAELSELKDRFSRARIEAVRDVNAITSELRKRQPR